MKYKIVDTVLVVKNLHGHNFDLHSKHKIISLIDRGGADSNYYFEWNRCGCFVREDELQRVGVDLNKNIKIL
jgi:hypothetical protein